MRVEKENEEIRAALQNFDKSGEHCGIKETEKLLHFIETTEMLTEFSDEVFTDFVENIYVYTRTCIGFRLKCGLTLKEEVCTGTK